MVTFPTQSGHTYTLQHKNTLADTAWQNILPAIVGDGTIQSISQPASQASRFYRLNVE
ncbi:MAG TPA: hypothetical protein VJS65_11655 [Verrucomicrobiae bacterium]|nr:hypothetical protein [Verrucomicrobiae bacterium]